MPVTDKDVASIIGDLEWRLIIANAEIKDLKAEIEQLKAAAVAVVNSAPVDSPAQEDPVFQ